MSTRRGFGASSVTVKRRKSRRQCEEGTNCAYQHEYQHQLEYAHDGTNTDTTTTRTPTSSAGRVVGGGDGARGGGSTRTTVSSINGTGARGREVRIAADGPRAKRTLRRGAEQDLVDIRDDDTREAQRARWIMKMQRDIEQASPLVQPQRQSQLAAAGSERPPVAAARGTGARRGQGREHKQSQSKNREVICLDCDAEDE